MGQLDAQLKLMGMQGVVGMAIGALDQALWDALGRAADLPVAVLLGGEPKPLDAYDSYGLVDIKTDLGMLEASVESGFEAIKIKLGAGEVAEQVATVAAVRKSIGPECKLMVDLNQSQTTAGAIDLILRLKEFDLTSVEEPVGAEDLHGHRVVREAVRPVPIQTGENWWFPPGDGKRHCRQSQRSGDGRHDQDRRCHWLDFGRGAGGGGVAAVVEPQLHRGKRAHHGLLPNRILV